jgi:2-oxoglutarate ferredoxin oxidoreductase subunit alpha
MRKDVFTYIVAGKAGEGVKKAGSVAARLFADMKRGIFEMDDYQSLIKGGHNFSVVSTAPGEISSHYMKADLIVAHDERSYRIHEEHCTRKGVIVVNSDEVAPAGQRCIGIPMTSEAKKYPPAALRIGVGSVAVLAAALGMDSDNLEALLRREYPRDVEKNIGYARVIYRMVYSELGGRFQLKLGEKKRYVLSGNEAAALGASAAGLTVYIAYPMTPSSSILHFLAAHDRELRVAVIHPENEIAVANMAIGAAFAGARTMVGSSGGGMALMEEAFSLAGMTETPVLFVLSSRSGPSTGVPTYTEQADLRFALNQGHGDFLRLVVAPGSVEETFYRAAELMQLVWKFQTPGILVMDKHISESSMAVDIHPEKAEWASPVLHAAGEYKRYLDTDDGISPLLFPPSEELIKWNSYEHDEVGITTDKADDITKMHEKRRRKMDTAFKYLKELKTVNTYGDGTSVIFTWGSTTMSVLEALRQGEIRARVVQPVYLEPFPLWELEQYAGNTVIAVEQSSTGQFALLLKEKAGIQSHQIKQYDGRPFDPEELASKIEEVL